MASLVLGADQYLFLDALSSVVTQHGHSVRAVARTSSDMVAHVRSQRPDMCLINRPAATADDAEIIGTVIAACGKTGVLVLGSDPSRQAVGGALGAGASGYVHKTRGVDALIAALDRVLNGKVVVDVPEVTSTNRGYGVSQESKLADQLTDREKECLLMLVEGLDTAAMATRLGVARNTIRTHLQSVLTKLGVHSRLEAASFAVRHRLAEV